MDIQGLIGNQYLVKFVMTLSRAMPEKMGESLTYRLGDYLASKKDMDFVRALRANQWVIGGEKASKEELDNIVRRNIQSIAQAILLMFRNHDDPEKMKALFHLTPWAEKIIEMSKHDRRGLVIVIVHTSSFDLMLQAASYYGLKGLMISLPETTDALEWQHNLRREAGTPVLPASYESVRTAVKRLKSGGMVLTGIDRPIPELKYKLHFFGRLASLPVHHIQMALMAKVPIVLACSHFQDDGTIRLSISEYIEMERYASRDETIMKNAEKVLKIGEKFLLEAPEQWAVYFPVWPEALSEMP